MLYDDLTLKKNGHSSPECVRGRNDQQGLLTSGAIMLAVLVLAMELPYAVSSLFLQCLPNDITEKSYYQTWQQTCHSESLFP
jgi:hypothetical protein